MAWDITKPSDSGAVADACAYTRANFVAADTALKKEHEDMALADGGEHLSGSARTYYDDYDLLANLPDLLAGDHIGYATGRLAFNNSANMPNQGWIFDGALWQPFVSPRSAHSTDDATISTAGTGAWTAWDTTNAMDVTLYETDNGDWQYDVSYSGTFQIVNGLGATSVYFRLHDGTTTITYDAVYFAAAGTLFLPARFNGIYTPAAAGATTIVLEFLGAIGTTVARQVGLVGDDSIHHCIVKEIPA